MPITYPNQRVVTIHRERASTDFLGIKNMNWQYAARDLGAHALLLYLYLASNADGYNLALSPAAVRQAVGMARSTYHDQFLRLIDKGYLVPTGGNGFAFYEVPQPRRENNQTPISSDGLNFEECTGSDNSNSPVVQSISVEDIEINNKESSINTIGTNSGLDAANEIKAPTVKEVRIPVPQRKAKKELFPKPERTGFVF